MRVCAPSSVLPNVMLPLPPPFDTLVVPLMTTGEAKERGPPVVKRAPESETVPLPVWLKAPAIEVLDPAVSVKEPVFTIATGAPEAVVVRFPSIVNEAPVSEIPPMRVAVKLP